MSYELNKTAVSFSSKFFSYFLIIVIIIDNSWLFLKWVISVVISFKCKYFFKNLTALRCMQNTVLLMADVIHILSKKKKIKK